MAKTHGVYADGRGGWYFKATLGKDALTGKRVQITKRGFASAAAATRARRDLLGLSDTGRAAPTPAGLTLDQLLDQYLDGIDADAKLGVKTRFDYRRNADAYVRPLLGKRKVRDVTPAVLLEWQRVLAKGGAVKKGGPLAPNTIRLARAPLAGAFAMAVRLGLVGVSPLGVTPRPTKTKSVPKHWSPEQAREFLDLHASDREWAVWAFLLGGGLRIGELVALRWPNIDLKRRRATISEFSTTLGYDVVASNGKSRDATRSIDLDKGLVDVLKGQRRQQAAEKRAAANYVESDHVFTRAAGGAYHPQTLSKMLARLSEQAGLPRLTAHGLRHTSATLMLAEGVQPKVAAERLGHADPTLFMALYSHVTPTMQRDAADRVGAALFGPGK
ncbi:MAG TPA: tyrosine-type recombinase/integrase [Acidimicrobiales bacterium]|nr:tyrosine-type recombinase/integrase [Acidimicrobiales bacterium]